MTLILRSCVKQAVDIIITSKLCPFASLDASRRIYFVLAISVLITGWYLCVLG